MGLVCSGLGGGFGAGGGLGGFGIGRSPISCLGWILTLLAAASLGVGIANVAYTYVNYNKYIVNNNCPAGNTITICPVTFTYISSGIWASLVIFFTGILAIRSGGTMWGLFRLLVLLSTIAFAPAMAILNALEVVAYNIGANAAGLFYGVTSSSIAGDVTKFALPLTDAVLAGLEFLILILMCVYICRGGGLTAVGGGFGSFFPSAPNFGGVIGGGMYAGGDYGGDDFGDDDDSGDIVEYDDTSGGPGPSFIPVGGGGGSPAAAAAGGGAAGGGSSSSSGGGGSGSASNNNNNNIVVPPVIIPPAPAAPSFFPWFMPQQQQAAPQAPIIITTTTGPSNPAPQPVFVPLPTRRPLPPPVAPSRYFGYGRF